MYGHTPLLLSLGLLALMGGLPRLLQRGGGGGEAECPAGGGGPCALPFLSQNPLSLRCPGAAEAEEGTVHWQYLNLSPAGAGAQPRTFAGPRGLRALRGPLGQLGGRVTLRAGGSLLQLSGTRPADSGLYLCKAGAPAAAAAATLAAYRVEVQDAALLHVSHRALFQAPLGNQSVRLTGAHRRLRLRLHTRWAPWQDCDRCGATGERKRLGFCYAALEGVEEDEEEEEGEGMQGTKGVQGKGMQGVQGVQRKGVHGMQGAEGFQGLEEALPCGLMQLQLGQALPRRGPELRYETCRRPCSPGLAGAAASAADWLEPRALLLETLLLEPYEEARLECPGASVYTPVSWQRDAAPLTRLELLRRCNGSHRLEDATGGAVYRIAGVRASDRGVYRCRVRGRNAAAFHLELPEVPPPGRRRRARQLLAALRALLGSFALVFVVGALAELLHACWCEVL